MILESRESGRNVGIYDGEGAIKWDWVRSILADFPRDELIIEAPMESQQIGLLRRARSRREPRERGDRIGRSARLRTPRSSRGNVRCDPHLSDGPRTSRNEVPVPICSKRIGAWTKPSSCNYLGSLGGPSKADSTRSGDKDWCKSRSR